MISSIGRTTWWCNVLRRNARNASQKRFGYTKVKALMGNVGGYRWHGSAQYVIMCTRSWQIPWFIQLVTNNTKNPTRARVRNAIWSWSGFLSIKTLCTENNSFSLSAGTVPDVNMCGWIQKKRKNNENDDPMLFHVSIILYCSKLRINVLINY